MHWFWRAAIAVGVGLAVGYVMKVLLYLMQENTNPNTVLVIVYFLLMDAPGVLAGIGVYAGLTYATALYTGAAGETRCRKCGYILRGVSEPKCPECGERI